MSAVCPSARARSSAARTACRSDVSRQPSFTTLLKVMTAARSPGLKPFKAAWPAARNCVRRSPATLSLASSARITSTGTLEKVDRSTRCLTSLSQISKSAGVRLGTGRPRSVTSTSTRTASMPVLNLGACSPRQATPDHTRTASILPLTSRSYTNCRVTARRPPRRFSESCRRRASQGPSPETAHSAALPGAERPVHDLSP